MTSLERGRETLLATARTGPLSTARDRPTQGPNDACRFLATYIDRTVLARRIVVDFTDGTSLTLDARHRRVLRIGHNAALSLQADGRQALPDRVMRSDDSATVALELRAHLAGRTIHRLRVLDDPAIDFPDTPGITLTSLVADTPPALYRPDPEDLVRSLAGFVDHTSEVVVAACVIAPPDIRALCGTADTIRALAVWAEHALGLAHAKRGGSSPALGADYIGSLAWSGPDLRHLLIHRTPRAAGLVLIGGADMLACLPEWKASMHR